MEKFLFLPLLTCLMIFLLLNNLSPKFSEISKNPANLSNIFDLDIRTDLSNVSETEMEYSFDYQKLFKHLNLKNKEFPIFGTPFISRYYLGRSIFWSISSFVFAYRFNNLDPKKVQCGDIIFLQTDYIKDFVENYHPVIQFPYILITHDTDLGVGAKWQLSYLNDNKVIAWYAQETLAVHPKLKGLPLGIMFPPSETFTTVYNIARDILPYFKKKYLIYFNFSLETNKNRIKTLKYFEQTFANNSNVIIDTGRISWKDYLTRMKNSQFVLSPPGSGVDCYRTWEALMMGSVPIVLKTGLEPVYGDMPVMVVNDWTEVTEENMKKFQNEKLSNFSKDGFPWRPRIWFRYWLKEILITKLNYVNNYC